MFRNPNVSSAIFQQTIQLTEKMQSYCTTQSLAIPKVLEFAKTTFNSCSEEVIKLPKTEEQTTDDFFSRLGCRSHHAEETTPKLEPILINPFRLIESPTEQDRDKKKTVVAQEKPIKELKEEKREKDKYIITDSKEEKEIRELPIPEHIRKKTEKPNNTESEIEEYLKEKAKNQLGYMLLLRTTNDESIINKTYGRIDKCASEDIISGDPQGITIISAEITHAGQSDRSKEQKVDKIKSVFVNYCGKGRLIEISLTLAIDGYKKAASKLKNKQALSFDQWMIDIHHTYRKDIINDSEGISKTNKLLLAFIQSLTNIRQIEYDKSEVVLSDKEDKTILKQMSRQKSGCKDSEMCKIAFILVLITQVIDIAWYISSTTVKSLGAKEESFNKEQKILFAIKLNPITCDRNLKTIIKDLEKVVSSNPSNIPVEIIINNIIIEIEHMMIDLANNEYELKTLIELLTTTNIEAPYMGMCRNNPLALARNAESKYLEHTLKSIFKGLVRGINTTKIRHMTQ